MEPHCLGLKRVDIQLEHRFQSVQDIRHDGQILCDDLRVQRVCQEENAEIPDKPFRPQEHAIKLSVVERVRDYSPSTPRQVQDVAEFQGREKIC